jgi:hypothetical protein
MRRSMINLAKHALTWYAHDPSKKPIFLFATPRGGSTWLAELLWSQPGMRLVGEPLNLRNPEVSRALGFSDWSRMFDPDIGEYIGPYFERILRGSFKGCDRLPLKSVSRAGFRLRSDRVTLKIIHGGTDRISWFCENFAGVGILLIRHPLATAVSREVFPFLEHFGRSRSRERFTAAQLKVIDRVRHGNDKLAKGVVAWCLHNQLALESTSALIVTYEQLVLDRDSALEKIASHCSLDDVKRMKVNAPRPSRTTRLSDDYTRKALGMLHAESAERSATIIGKWRRGVPPQREQELMGVCELFGIDAYHPGRLLPESRYWIGAKYPEESALVSL